MTEQPISERRDGGQPRFVVTGGATDAEVAALVIVLSAVAATSTAAAAADPSVPDGRSRRELWAASLGPGLRSAITWQTSTWW